MNKNNPNQTFSKFFKKILCSNVNETLDKRSDLYLEILCLLGTPSENNVHIKPANGN